MSGIEDFVFSPLVDMHVAEGSSYIENQILYISKDYQMHKFTGHKSTEESTCIIKETRGSTPITSIY